MQSKIKKWLTTACQCQNKMEFIICSINSYWEGGWKLLRSDVVQVLCCFSKWCVQSFIFRFAGITYRSNDSNRIEEALKNQDIDNYNHILRYAPIQKIVRGEEGPRDICVCQRGPMPFFWGGVKKWVWIFKGGWPLDPLMLGRIFVSTFPPC